MLDVYVTVDTEYSAGLYRGSDKASYEHNYARSIACETGQGCVGIEYQMDMLDRFGQKAVFFVDPLPALIWGSCAAADVIEPILARGHEVQLHLHTEWLAFMDSNPLGNRTGRNIKDFTLEEQKQLIGIGIDLLTRSGAPRPVAFRAGNYGANDDTLRALHHHGIKFDTSFCPGIENSDCDISLGEDNFTPVHHCGIAEVPTSAIEAHGGGKRHAQLTALSIREIKAALRHANRQAIENFTMVSHSFELLSRDRKRINKIVHRRFEWLCEWLAGQKHINTVTYADSKPAVNDQAADLLPHNPLRTIERMAEQAVGNLLYGSG